jgi:hypothetical protein
MNDLSWSNVNNIDVLVIGAGPVGLATTLWFAKRNYNVVLIEQYGEIKTSLKKAFNERHQQVGLNLESLNFIKDLDVVVWGEIKKRGCPDDDWINIPIYIIQNVFMKEIRSYGNVMTLFNTVFESTNCPNPKDNCRIVLVHDDAVLPTSIIAVSPKIVIIVDGKHDDRGTARQFFGFASASKVQLSTYGIIGMTDRSINDEKGSTCLKNYSSNNHVSSIIPELGSMYIRLLGNMKERYIALGLGDNQNTDKFKNLNGFQIKNLLVEAYNLKRDTTMGELEITENDFTEYSRTPIPIILDYRKETIKLLEGSSTIVSIEGDAARKTTFFSGSGLNSGYKALQKLFDFCHENKDLIFGKQEDPNYLLTIDQKLLEKDQDCMHISLELLIKGINYIGRNDENKKRRKGMLTLSSDDPVIDSISPDQGEVPWFIHIKGKNLVSEGGKPPVCTFEWNGGDELRNSSSNNIIVYNSGMVGVKIPKNAEGAVTISLNRYDGKYATSPIKFTVTKVVDIPEITSVYKEDEWLCIDGNNFKIPVYVTILDGIKEHRIKAYSNSTNSLIIPSTDLKGEISFVVDTSNGTSNKYTIIL